MSWADIPGFSGFTWLYDDVVSRLEPGAVIVEVGVALGHSIAYLARKVIDSGKDIQIWAVDPWAGVARNGEQQAVLGGKARGDFDLFLRTMMIHAPDELEILRVVRAPSVRAARLFRDESVDLVLIDAAHDAPSVSDDIEVWRSKIRPGGILAGDDHEPTYPGVQLGCRTCFGIAGYEVTGSTWWRWM
jgi:hypothetical protein